MPSPEKLKNVWADIVHGQTLVDRMNPGSSLIELSDCQLECYILSNAAIWPNLELKTLPGNTKGEVSLCR